MQKYSPGALRQPAADREWLTLDTGGKNPRQKFCRVSEGVPEGKHDTRTAGQRFVKRRDQVPGATDGYPFEAKREAQVRPAYDP